MNIVKQNVDELNALLKVQVNKEDYEEKVNKILKDYQKKASIKGFRPGKVPASFINKTYRIPVLVEEINKLVSESINEYLKKENIQILGDPMPSENKSINWDVETEFEFTFELGLAPNVQANVSDKDKIDYYDIAITDKMLEEAVDNYTRRYGKHSDAEIIEENSIIKADVAELKEGGVKADDVTLSIEVVKDEDIKKSMVGKKAGDKITIDLKKAYPNDYEISGMLKIKKEEVAELTSEFEISIKSVSKFTKAEVDQKLFDLIFGEGMVVGEEQFRKRITDDIKGSLESESDYKFFVDARKFYLSKIQSELPKDFLVRWMFASNEGKYSREQIDKEYPLFEENLKWQLIKNSIIKDADIKIDDNDVKTKAKDLARRQFRQYGIFNITDEYLEDYSSQMMKRQEDVKQIVNSALDDKVFAFLKTKVSLIKKEVSTEEFNKLFEQ